MLWGLSWYVVILINPKHNLQNNSANTVHLHSTGSYPHFQRYRSPCRTRKPHTVSKTKKTFCHFVQIPLLGCPFSVYSNLGSLKSASPRHSSGFFHFLSLCSLANTYIIYRQYMSKFRNIFLLVQPSVTRSRPPCAECLQEKEKKLEESLNQLSEYDDVRTTRNSTQERE